MPKKLLDEITVIKKCFHITLHNSKNPIKTFESTKKSIYL